LSNAPWPGTSALYWAEVELSALQPEGPRTLQVHCNENRHAVSATFSFTIGGQPEHDVRIVATDATTGAPIDAVEVRLGAFRATTDDDGVATLAVPGGGYEVILWKVGYQTSPVSSAVSEDVSVPVEMEVVRKAEQPSWRRTATGITSAEWRRSSASRDGDKIRLGKTELTAHHHPGHTKGSTSVSFTTEDAGRTYRVLIANMNGINDGVKLLDSPGYPNIVEEYARTFEKQKQLTTEVFRAEQAYRDQLAKEGRRQVNLSFG
jgi:hypothetical protein